MPSRTIVGAQGTGAIACEPMTTKTVPYNVSEQLRTPEERAAYLEAWLIEAPDDKAGIVRAFRDVSRAQPMTVTFSVTAE